MVKWRIDYRDTASRGETRTVRYEGECSEEQVIDFFGLHNDDVEWYKVIRID